MEFIRTHLAEIITAFTGLFAWLFEHKKRKLEARENTAIAISQETKTTDGIVDLYQEALDDLKKRYDAKFKEMGEEISHLKKNQELWKTKYRTLKKEFDNYRKGHE